MQTWIQEFFYKNQLSYTVFSMPCLAQIDQIFHSNCSMDSLVLCVDLLIQNFMQKSCFHVHMLQLDLSISMTPKEVGGLSSWQCARNPIIMYAFFFIEPLCSEFSFLYELQTYLYSTTSLGLPRPQIPFLIFVLSSFWISQPHNSLHLPLKMYRAHIVQDTNAQKFGALLTCSNCLQATYSVPEFVSISHSIEP